MSSLHTPIAIAAAALVAATPSAAKPGAEHELVVTGQHELLIGDPLVLTTSSILAVSARTFSDEERAASITLIEHLDGEPVVTSLPLPEDVVPGNGFTGNTADPLLVRLSATRALVLHAGADYQMGTGDEGVLLLDDLGGANTVTPISLFLWDKSALVRLDERTVATSGDGETVLLSDLGGANEVVTGVQGWLPRLALSPTRLVTELLPAGHALVKLEPGGPVAVPLPDDVNWSYAIGLAGRRALVVEAGGVRVVPDVDVPETSVLVSAPGMAELTRVSPDRAVAHLLGADGVPATADDAAAWFEDLGGENRVRIVRAPRASSAFPVSLGLHAAVLGGGPGFVVVRDRGPALPLRLPGAEIPVALSPSRFLVATPNGDPQELMRVMAARRGARPSRFTIPYAHSHEDGPNPPILLGNGRALRVENPYWSMSPVTRAWVIGGLPGGTVLDDVALAVTGPDVALDARFALPEPEVFALADLTLRIGDVRQTIPAASLAETPRGFRYEDAAGANGFFRLVEYDARARTLHAEGRSAEPDAPLGTNRVVSLESTEFSIASASE